MPNATDFMPDDIPALQGLVASQRHEIEHLKLLVAKLQRIQFGRRAEPHESADQLTLIKVPDAVAIASIPLQRNKASTPRPFNRKPLPSHLPREIERYAPSDSDCPQCGGSLNAIGEDVSEVLEYIPARFKVVQQVRPKFSCSCCQTLHQAPAPERPIARGLAGPGLLAQVLVSKYADHLPLYRQSRIYARDGVDLSRSTLADWVGQCSTLLSPLVEAIRRHVLAGNTLHADDTPVPVLSPGNGKTKTGRFWTYVRDERPAGSEIPPAVWFAYSPDRKGKHPQTHLQPYRGAIHADGYAGFNALYDEQRIEVACWAHVRRKFYDIHQAQASPLAATALNFIQQLYGIEKTIRGEPPDSRKRIRQSRAGPLLKQLHQWLHSTLTQVSRKSALAEAIRYALVRWSALTQYRDNGSLEMDNNAAERALRGVALGRKNYLFVGSNAGGERAAIAYSLIGTVHLNGLDPFHYLKDVIGRITSHPINRIDELLPWHDSMQRTLDCTDQVA